MANTTADRSRTVGHARRRSALALAAGLSALAAELGCGGGISLTQRVQAGGSFVYALEAEGTQALGFASTLGGADALRGALEFALCPPEERLCQVGGGTGFALETQFMTRIAADPFSPAALAGAGDPPALPLPGAAVALLRVPGAAEGGPTPGRYRVEARRTSAGGVPQDVLGGAGAALEILPGAGEPLLPTAALAQFVPLPRLTLSAQSAVGAGRSAPAKRGPAAAQLLIRFPEKAVQIRGVAVVGRADPQALLLWEPGPTRDTIRVQLLAPQGGVRALGLALEPVAGGEPLRLSDFRILEQRSYDERGGLRGDLGFAIEAGLR